MKKLHCTFMYITLILCCLSIQYPLNSQESPNSCEEAHCIAYQETSRCAHWSAYIPLVAILASAAFFGWADTLSTSSSDKSSYYSHYSCSDSSANSSANSSGCSCTSYTSYH